jgi:hypothetical protein
MCDGHHQKWNSIADAGDLHTYIQTLAKRKCLLAEFYDLTRPPGVPAVCQGDILELNAKLVHLNDAMVPTASPEPVRFWMVLGNTCDFTRDLEDVKASQIVPLVTSAASAISESALREFRAYKHARLFHLPPWDQSVIELFMYADLVRPVTVSKRALLERNCVVARLGFPGWILFNSCVMRFLARDDQRFV